MGTLKSAMMNYSYEEQQHLMQGLSNGLHPTDYPYHKYYGGVSGGMMDGSNSSSPSTQKMEVSAASRPKTLIFNERAKRNTTTQETKPTTGQHSYIVTAAEMQSFKISNPRLYHHAVLHGYGPAV